MDSKTARAFVALLKNAAQAAGDPTAPTPWRVQRDRFVDLLDPQGEHASFGDGEISQLIEFFAATAATPASRLSVAEWQANVDAAVVRLLSLLGAPDRGSLCTVAKSGPA